MSIYPCVRSQVHAVALPAPRPISIAISTSCPSYARPPGSRRSPEQPRPPSPSRPRRHRSKLVAVRRFAGLTHRHDDRPQFASSPAIAVFTSGEFATAIAIRFADWRGRDGDVDPHPLLAPSPSPVTCNARSSSTSSAPGQNPPASGCAPRSRRPRESADASPDRWRSAARYRTSRYQNPPSCS